MGRKCEHRHPLLVLYTEAGLRARCLSCEAIGPVRMSLPEAMKALRNAPGPSPAPTEG